MQAVRIAEGGDRVAEAFLQQPPRTCQIAGQFPGVEFHERAVPRRVGAEVDPLRGELLDRGPIHQRQRLAERRVPDVRLADELADDEDRRAEAIATQQRRHVLDEVRVAVVEGQHDRLAG